MFGQFYSKSTEFTFESIILMQVDLRARPDHQAAVEKKKIDGKQS